MMTMPPTLPPGFTLGTSARMRRTHDDGSGRVHLTLNGNKRLDRTRTFSIPVRNRAELRFVRQF